MVLVIDDDHNDLALFAVAVDHANRPIWVQNASGTEQAIDYLEGRGILPIGLCTRFPI